MDDSNPLCSLSSRRSLIPYPSQGLSQVGFDSTDLMLLEPMQLMTSTTSLLPSNEELDRMERWIALQERAADLNPLPKGGHTYGKLAVTGNARAVRGNVYENSTSLSCTRNHTYGEGLAINGGVIWEGDISLSAFNNGGRPGPKPSPKWKV